MVVATPASGGYALPEVVLRDIERFEKMFSPVRDLVKVVRTDSGDVKQLVNLRGATAGWINGESGSRSQTSTPDLREVVLKGSELAAVPRASNWALDDMFFDVGAWLAEEVAQAFAEAEGEAVIRGSGTNQYLGLLADPPSSRDDFDSPIRAAGEFQYVDDGDSPHGITIDTLISAAYKLNAAYRVNASWVANSNTWSVIRKLKTSAPTP